MLFKYPGRILLLGTAALLLLWHFSVPYVCCAQISYPDVSPERTYVQLPYFQMSSEKTARFNATLSVYSLPFQGGSLWVKPDDCVTQVNVNGNPIDPAFLKSQPHCSDSAVSTIIPLHLQPYLQPGKNEVEIEFSDKGGGYGLDAGVAHGSAALLLMFALAASLLYPLHLFVHRQKHLAWALQLIPQRYRQNMLVPAVISLLTLFYLWPILSTGQWYFSHAQDSYLYEMEMFRDSIAHGIWYPRWLPRLEGGYGYPTFLFIAPAIFYLTLPFLWLLNSVTYAFYGSLIVLTIAGLAGAYRLARLYCGRDASIACMCLFLVSHYCGVNVFPRGDITEFGAMMVGPWLLYYFLRLSDAIEARNLKLRDCAALSLVLLLLLTLHPLVFLYSSIPGLLLLAGKWIESGFNGNMLIIPALCAAAAMVAGSPYWYTAMQMKAYINQGGVFITDGTHNFSDFFNNSFFNPGAPQMLLAMMGWFSMRHKVFYRFAFAAHLFMLFMLTDYSQVLWKLDTPFKYSQFQWRINSVITVIQLLGMIQFFRWASPRIAALKHKQVRQLLLPVTALLSVILSIYSFHTGEGHIERREPYRIWGPIDYETHKREWEQKEFIYAGVYREFFPATANYDGLPNRLTAPVPLVEGARPRGSRISMAEDSNDYAIHFKFAAVGSSNLDEMPSVTINQMDFPGWKVQVNGQKAHYSDEPAFHRAASSWYHDDRGRIRITFPQPDNYEVHIWYSGPPGWLLRNILIMLGLSGLAWAMRRQCAIANTESITSAAHASPIAANS